MTQAFATPLGGITLYLDVQRGSVSKQTLVIKNIDPALHKDARELSVGDDVAATGLVADERGSGYWLGGAGVFTANRSSETA